MTHTERVLDLLSDGKPHTHHEVYKLGVIGHSRIADLRKQGHRIDCWQEVCFGERVSVYQLRPLDASTAGAPLLVGGPPTVVEASSGPSSNPYSVDADAHSFTEPVRDGDEPLTVHPDQQPLWVAA